MKVLHEDQSINMMNEGDICFVCAIWFKVMVVRSGTQAHFLTRPPTLNQRLVFVLFQPQLVRVSVAFTELTSPAVPLSCMS